jgi:hypothetical protein
MNYRSAYWASSLERLHRASPTVVDIDQMQKERPNLSEQAQVIAYLPRAILD